MQRYEGRNQKKQSNKDKPLTYRATTTRLRSIVKIAMWFFMSCSSSKNWICWQSCNTCRALLVDLWLTCGFP